MSSLADLVEELPARVKRVRRVHFEPQELEGTYTDEARDRWLEDLDREAEIRGEMLPNVRAARRLYGEDLERAILADLVYELERTVKRPGDDGEVLKGWTRAGVGRGGEDVTMPPLRAVRGPAPVTNIGLRATLRSYIDAREPCDRYDSLIRHAATALLLAEQIAVGRA